MDYLKHGLLLFISLLTSFQLYSSNDTIEVGDSLLNYVNPFIGTTNFGTTNPGAVAPNGMISVTPFNVMGSDENKYDKDSRWFSTPYEYHNVFFTGFSHVNLSGVGCPDLGAILLMPTSGKIEVNYKNYGSKYSHEVASPGYYSNVLSKYNIKTEVTAGVRSSIARFTFPKGQANILLNLGEGLTNESGAYLKRTSENEIEGMKLLGTFCYNPQAVFPVYFVMRISKKPKTFAYWKKQRPMKGVEAEWDKFQGKYKTYTKYQKEIFGDDIGAFFSFDSKENELIEVQIGISYVSTKNARENLESEQKDFDFEQLLSLTKKKWEETLGKVTVQNADKNSKTVFYTALYHTQLHPNILNDVNGDYPEMESRKIGHTNNVRYTVFSLWDTYRATHQLFTLLYPRKQLDMIRSMVDMYKESGWLPRWELYGRETLTMEGDPAIPVIVDSWMKGLRDFDTKSAYEAMKKSALTKGKNNLIRPDNDEYLALGYIPLHEKFDQSVSHALEYYTADYALARFAEQLGHKNDAKRFYKQAGNYKKYYSEEFGTMRPITSNGKFLTPFNPTKGMNFEPVPGFHEGSAWNYTFAVPFDVKGMIKLMGGEKAFVNKLQNMFDKKIYDPTNEPNISFPFLFSYVKGEEWRTQKTVKKLLEKCFTNAPDGIPGNDDTGTMSAWAVFSMMGFYPDNPTDPSYTFCTPAFDKIEIQLDPKYAYGNDKLRIETVRPSKNAFQIDKIFLDGKQYHSYRISHKKLMSTKKIVFYLK